MYLVQEQKDFVIFFIPYCFIVKYEFGIFYIPKLEFRQYVTIIKGVTNVLKNFRPGKCSVCRYMVFPYLEVTMCFDRRRPS